MRAKSRKKNFLAWRHAVAQVSIACETLCLDTSFTEPQTQMVLHIRKSRGCSSHMSGSSVLSCLALSLHSCTKPRGLTVLLSPLLYGSRLQSDIWNHPNSMLKPTDNHYDNYRFSKQGSQQKYHTLDAPRGRSHSLEKHWFPLGEAVWHMHSA